MRATGIVRRMDDLGRVVIPKEVRHSMKLKEGDAMEIFTEGNSLILQKYYQTEEITAALKNVREAVVAHADPNKRAELLKKLDAVQKELDDDEDDA